MNSLNRDREKYFQPNTGYVCPLCGAPVNYTIACTYPATHCYKCTKCSYHKDIRESLPEQKIAPL